MGKLYLTLVVGSVRYIKLTHVGFRAHVKIASRIVSYRSVLSPLSIQGLATPWTYFSPFVSVLCHSLTDSSTASPVHVLMLSIVVFLSCVHLALFLALSLSPGNSLVSSRCIGLELRGASLIAS